MAEFTDDFNRSNSNTVGNGWSEIQLSASDVRIDSNKLDFTTGANAAIAWRSPETGYDSKDISIEIFWNKDNAAFNAEYQGLSVTHDGVTGSTSRGMNLRFRCDTAGTDIELEDNSGLGVIASADFDFSVSTDYKIWWKINSDWTQEVWIAEVGNDYPETAQLSYLTPFTPNNSTGEWAIGGRYGFEVDEVTYYDGAIDPPASSTFVATMQII